MISLICFFFSSEDMNLDSFDLAKLLLLIESSSSNVGNFLLFFIVVSSSSWELKISGCLLCSLEEGLVVSDCFNLIPGNDMIDGPSSIGVTDDTSLFSPSLAADTSLSIKDLASSSFRSTPLTSNSGSGCPSSINLRLSSSNSRFSALRSLSSSSISSWRSFSLWDSILLR